MAIPVTEHDYIQAAEHMDEGGPVDGVDAPGDSVFSNRTDPSSAEQYFQFYSLLSQQQNMLQDYVRTGTYQRAILTNTLDFRDKVVLDVGAGSGILSFFAVQAGARRVYAVEASSVAKHCESLVAANRLAGRIVVLRYNILTPTIGITVRFLYSLIDGALITVLVRRLIAGRSKR